MTKKSIEELKTEAEALRKLKAEKDERQALEHEVAELRKATGKRPLAFKVAGLLKKGVVAAGKQVASDIEAISKEMAEEEKPRKKKAKE